MNTDRCPKCGGRDIRTKRMTNPHSGIQITALRTAKPTYQICVTCGYVEIYVADAESRQRIADKWKP